MCADDRRDLCGKGSDNRRPADASLEELLTFERLLADLSASFANVSGDQLETEIASALRQLLEFLGFDRCNFFEFTADGWADILCSVATNGVQPYPPGPAPASLNWYLGQVREKTMRVRSLDDLPPEAIGEIEYRRRSGIRSSLGIPLRVGGRIIGFIGFSAFRSTREWPDDLIARLKIVGEVMAQALVRKRSEAALRASEERWRSVFESTTLGIAILDETLRYTATNSAFKALLGYSDEELAQLTPMDISVEEDRELTRNRLMLLRCRKLSHVDIEKQYRCKDGSLIWVHNYASLVSDDGTKALIIGIVIDITRSKQAEERLREMQSEVTRVSRLTAMGQMTASIAHEISQPLAAIAANGNAALRWLRRTPPDITEVQEVLERIGNDVRRASQTIAGIRAMFTKGEPASTLLDVNSLISEVLELLRLELKGNRISVYTKLDQQLPQLVADRVQLQQVLLNLVMNAAEAMSSAQNRSRMLTIRSQAREPGEIVIAVEDTGPGIDAKHIDRIFDPFFTTKSSGMGMGLSICRSIVEAHHGRLMALSDISSGTVFEIILPVCEPGGS